ncbi:twin-arginine translocase subunit TatC [Paenibacillus aurantius]|uniref:Sec-independent protein translocase protein TatC n=1 Tax=Paenibacillus aurantius TaxID=2918900 RepID=A0AA96RH08_9BACL|nr:twin-arginine translocase subunit TatC [Paenibacillus aurantius]WNQ10619.1 twin-arginine translocase subunit TatC [Paenibacillus aurantius]
MDKDKEIIRHLTELRKRLIVVILWFLAAMAAGLYMSRSILLYIKHSPPAADVEWNVFSLTDGMFIYMKCAFLFAVLCTLPVAFYHVWSFVKPGLTEEEARGTAVYIPISFVLFVAGLAFSYYIVFPMMVDFMKNVNVSIGATERYGIDRYFSFLFNVIFPMGIAFEMPVAVIFLTRLGLLTPARLKMTRKYAYLGLAVVGACISPPDFVSHLSVTVPLILLFELSVIVAGWYYRRMQAAAAL